jgi:hypothetical protein
MFLAKAVVLDVQEASLVSHLTHNTVALLKIVPLGPEFGGSNTQK